MPEIYLSFLILYRMLFLRQFNFFPPTPPPKKLETKKIINLSISFIGFKTMIYIFLNLFFFKKKT